MGRYREALSERTKALRVHEAAGNKPAVPTSLLNIGITYLSLGDIRHGLDYIEQSLELMRAGGNRSGEASCLINIGLLKVDLETTPAARSARCRPWESPRPSATGARWRRAT